MICPICGSPEFFLKDEDDPYETCAFTFVEGSPSFLEEGDERELLPETEIHCNRCSWH